MPPPLRVAVLGGGPVGLEAALYARAAGQTATLYEAGQPGESVGRWGFARMFTPFGLNASRLGRAMLRTEQPKRDLPADTDLLTGREFRDAYLAPLAQSEALAGCVRAQSAVLAVGRGGWRKGDTSAGKRPPFRLLVRGANGGEAFETADAVFDCTGTYGRPNWIGDGGIPAAGELASRPHLALWLEDVRGAKKAVYANRSVLLVGGGYSAAATACDLADLATEFPSTWVVWLTRGPRTHPLPRVPNDPFKERDRLAARANQLATRGADNLEHHPDVRIDEVVCAGPDKGVRVAGRVNGKAAVWEADKLIANVGYKPDMNLTAELQVSEPTGDIRTAEPGYYVLGAKSFGRDSGFLLSAGHEQVRRAFAELLGNAKLDLYAKAG